MAPSPHKGFLALHLADDPVPAGYLPFDAAELLLRHGMIAQTSGRLVLDEGGSVSDRLEDVRNLLARHGLIGPPKGEAMPVRVVFDGPVVGTIDRSVLRILGLWATKVHVNGLVQGMDGPSVWLSRRAPTSAAEPGTFDTLVAGGQSASESELLTAHKEGREEAGLTGEQLAKLRLVKRIPVQYGSGLGFHRELLVIYDLDLDTGFEPHCKDGEIDQHICVGLGTLAKGKRTLTLKRSSKIVCTDLVHRYIEQPACRRDRNALARSRRE